MGANLGGSVMGGGDYGAGAIQQGLTGAALYTKAAGVMPGVAGPDTTPFTSSGATVDTQAADMLPPVNMPPDLAPLPTQAAKPGLLDYAKGAMYGMTGQTPPDSEGALYWDEGRQMYVKPARKRWF